MPTETILQHYSRAALKRATIERMDDGNFVGVVPGLDGVIAFGETERECAVDVYSAVEDWARFRVRKGMYLPVIGAVDLNSEGN